MPPYALYASSQRNHLRLRKLKYIFYVIAASTAVFYGAIISLFNLNTENQIAIPLPIQSQPHTAHGPSLSPSSPLSMDNPPSSLDTYSVHEIPTLVDPNDAALNNTMTKKKHHKHKTKSIETSSPLAYLPRWSLFCIFLLCLLVAALAAGLTLSYMSLDIMGLEIITHTEASPPDMRQAATKIMALREDGHRLLVTLLLLTTLSTELLPLVVESIYPTGYIALFVSVGSVLLFGEIIPQAVCSRNALEWGAFFFSFVKVMLFIFYPVAKPIAWILDRMLGHEEQTAYNRHELSELINLHTADRGGTLTFDEKSILQGVMTFSGKTVDKIMTAADDVYMLDINTVLTKQVLNDILRFGHSRIPLYHTTRSNIIALLLTKQLILHGKKENMPLWALLKKKKKAHRIRVILPLMCSKNTYLADLLNEFQVGRSHMAIIYDDISLPDEQRTFLGIVTLEDIIEEILQEEIVDETDLYFDNKSKLPLMIRDQTGKVVRTIPFINQHSAGPAATLDENKPLLSKAVSNLEDTLGKTKVPPSYASMDDFAPLAHTSIISRNIDSKALKAPMAKELSKKRKPKTIKRKTLKETFDLLGLDEHEHDLRKLGFNMDLEIPRKQKNKMEKKQDPEPVGTMDAEDGEEGRALSAPASIHGSDAESSASSQE